MAWLTVKEAAQWWLDISEAAVRKLIKRNMLEHRKCPNGQVCVYRDGEQDGEADEQQDEKTGDKDEGRDKKVGETSEKRREDTADGPRSWWDYAVGVSALVVLFGALIYGLGLFALSVPIARVYTNDISTAWYATSLVPRPVVAGLGMRQLVAVPLIVGIIFACLLLVIQPSLGTGRNNIFNHWYLKYPLLLLPAGLGVVYGTWVIDRGPGPLSDESRLWIAFLLIISCLIWLSLARVIWTLRNRNFPRAARWALTLFVVAAIGTFADWVVIIPDDADVGAAIGTFADWGGIRPDDADSLVPVRETIKDSLIGFLDAFIVTIAIVIIVVGTLLTQAKLEEDWTPESRLRSRVRMLAPMAILPFIGALLLTPESNAHLPKAKLTVEDKDHKAVGPLLTHVDGYWYIIDQQENAPGNHLKAISDDKVIMAQVSKK